MEGALRAAVALVASWSLVGVAAAQRPPGDDPAPGDVAPVELDDGVRWDESWERFRPWQWAAAPALLGGSLALRYLGPQPSGRWSGGGLENGVVDALAIRRDPARHRIVLATDLHLFGSLGLLLADAVLTAGVAHGRWDVALQMLMIDLQSVAVVTTVLWSAQLLADRARPYERFCDEPEYPAIVRDCEDNASERGRGFIAGHTAIVTTVAGLTCTHHGHMPLFGGGLADSLTCGVLIGAAVLNGVGRIATENHYASDVLLGFGLGGLAGWLLPAALHYGLGEPEGAVAALAPVRGGGTLVVIGPLH